jgi:tetratricopeptide (TPR) repeat protein
MRDLLEDARVVFTGRLASMGRKEAYQIVVDHGGKPQEHISRWTSILIVGMEGWPLLPDGTVSNKIKRAEKLNREGSSIRVIPEAVFLELAGRQARPSDDSKTYPAEKVYSLLKIEPEALRRWEQLSLVRSQDGCYDFQDLVSLRTIAALVSQGVRPQTIAKSLQALAGVLPDLDRPLAQLKIVAENRRLLVELGETRLAPNGQLLLNFDSRPTSMADIVSVDIGEPSAIDWFEHGQSLEEDECYSEAAEAYRMALSLRPGFPDVYFNLANVLRAIGRLDAAEETYRTAVAQDPSKAAAWYNLADVQEEQGQMESAVASLQAALQASPNYADAHFNLALCLEKMGRCRDAERHWAAYLRLDGSSPWAEIAKNHLLACTR